MRSMRTRLLSNQAPPSTGPLAAVSAALHIEKVSRPNPATSASQHASAARKIVVSIRASVSASPRTNMQPAPASEFRTLQGMTTKELVRVIKAVAAQAEEHRPSSRWLSTTADCLRPKLRSLEPRDLSAVLRAYLDLGHQPDPDWLHDYDSAVTSHARPFPPAATCEVLACLASLDETPSLRFPGFVAARLETQGGRASSGGRPSSSTSAGSSNGTSSNHKNGSSSTGSEREASTHATSSTQQQVERPGHSHQQSAVNSSSSSSPLSDWNYFQLSTALQCLRHFECSLSPEAMHGIGSRMGELMLNMTPYELQMLLTGQSQALVRQ